MQPEAETRPERHGDILAPLRGGIGSRDCFLGLELLLSPLAFTVDMSTCSSMTIMSILDKDMNRNIEQYLGQT